MTAGRIRSIVGVGLVVLLFAFAFPAIAPYGTVADTWASIDRRWWLPLAVVSVANLVAPSTAQVAALPGLALKRACVTDWATSAVTNTIPAGSVIATGMTFQWYRRWGFDAAAVTRSILLTGLWDVVVKLVMPMTVLAWLLMDGDVPRAFWQAAGVGAILLVIGLALLRVLLSPTASHGRIARLFDRLPWTGENWDERLTTLRADTRTTVAERWIPLTFWTLAGHLNLLFLLVLCVRAVGASASALSLAGVATAFAFGRLISALPITPGGLGVVDAGLIGGLAAVGDASNATLVSAVLLFRALTFVLPIPLGVVSMIAFGASPTSLSPPPEP